MPEPCVLRVRDAACRYMELDPRLKVIWQNSRRKYAFEQTLAPSSLWDNADASGKRMSRPRPAKHLSFAQIAVLIAYAGAWLAGKFCSKWRRLEAWPTIDRKS